MIRRFIFITLLLVAVLGLAACGGGGPHPTASPSPVSGIYGIAVTDPVGAVSVTTTPSPLPGGFGDSRQVPIAHAHLVVKDKHGATVARITADGQGIFRLSLPPGAYTVWGTTGYTAQKTSVTVSADGYTRAVVYAYYHY